ncbi:MAG TPA: hypothetical protein VK324_14905 [Tepidisphaeraceae bacterium]|nr:hypothetical protein [Tepidisphaeraceae bacterium]
MDADLAAQLARRDRLRRVVHARRTPAERVAEMMRLQAAAWAALRASPEGYLRYLRRNYRARRPDAVAALLAATRRAGSDAH